MSVSLLLAGGPIVRVALGSTNVLPQDAGSIPTACIGKSVCLAPTRGPLLPPPFASLY
jgi:hypothetical protein